MATTYIPSPELIVSKLLQDLDAPAEPGYFDGTGFSTTLPKLTTGNTLGQVVNNWGDKTTWIVTSPIGGFSATGTNLFSGTVAVDVFARPKVAGKNAPWGVASAIAQQIPQLAIDWVTNVDVTVQEGSTTFRTVNVSSFDVLGFPSRINNDPNGLAHLAMTVSITYSIPRETPPEPFPV